MKTPRQDSWHFESISEFDQINLSKARMYMVAGQRDTPILFVHGGYHGAWCWTPWMRELARDGWNVCALDLRGHGGLPQTDDFVQDGVEQAAFDVLEALDNLKRPAVLVGHSLGALVAMVAAQHRPLTGLVLMAPSPPGQLPGLSPLPAYPEDRVVPPPQGVVAHQKFLNGYAGDVTSFLQRLCPESPRMMNDRYLLRIHVDRQKIDCPVLVLGAGRDLPHLHPPGQDEAVADFFEGEYRFLQDSSHDMMLDDSRGLVKQHLVEWLHLHQFS